MAGRCSPSHRAVAPHEPADGLGEEASASTRWWSTPTAKRGTSTPSDTMRTATNQRLLPAAYWLMRVEDPGSSGSTAGCLGSKQHQDRRGLVGLVAEAVDAARRDVGEVVRVPVDPVLAVVELDRPGQYEERLRHRAVKVRSRAAAPRGDVDAVEAVVAVGGFLWPDSGISPARTIRSRAGRHRAAARC